MTRSNIHLAVFLANLVLGSVGLYAFMQGAATYAWILNLLVAFGYLWLFRITIE
jgi:hypothetical protein